MIDAVSNTGGAQNEAQPLQTNPNVLGKDAFLKLLVAQLNYQDPISPMQNEQFVAQLAQFSSLEQMQNMNRNLEDSINADYLLNQAMNNSLVTTLIGKDVVATTSVLPHTSGEPTSFGIRLADDTESVEIEIYDSNGNVVRTISAGKLAAGEHTLSWDGKDSQGNDLPEGTYGIRVNAFALDGASPVRASTYLRGTITGVRYEEGVAFLLLGNIELNLGDVERILQKE